MIEAQILTILKTFELMTSMIRFRVNQPYKMYFPPPFKSTSWVSVLFGF